MRRKNAADARAPQFKAAERAMTHSTRCLVMYGRDSHQYKRIKFLAAQRWHDHLYPQFA